MSDKLFKILTISFIVLAVIDLLFIVASVVMGWLYVNVLDIITGFTVYTMVAYILAVLNILVTVLVIALLIIKKIKG
ncbi:MAG: hypothetical protein J6V40_02855 [Clostridia bacterium]|nr:hypothetical protein [Clostridia bacterium]